MVGTRKSTAKATVISKKRASPKKAIKKTVRRRFTDVDGKAVGFIDVNVGMTGKATSLSKSHVKLKEDLIAAFFLYMEKSKDYSDLATLVKDPRDKKSLLEVCKFFLETAGHKTPTSFRIVNECMILFYMNYKKIAQDTDTPLNFGNEFEPSVTKKHFGTLLGIFKNYGVPYVLSDFKCTGGVASLAEETWGAALAARPGFGSSTNRSKVDPNLQTKLHENACPVIQPYSCYKDLICILRVLLGLRLLYRGCKEVSFFWFLISLSFVHTYCLGLLFCYSSTNSFSFSTGC